MTWDLNILFWLCVSLAIGILFACVTFSINPLEPGLLNWNPHVHVEETTESQKREK